MKLRWAVLPLCAAFLSGGVQAQSGRESALHSGLEFRALRFEGLPNLRRLEQTVIPLALVIARDRLQVDVGTAYASTELLRTDSSHNRVSHLTDSQVRASYVFGSDAVVATVAFNLPTGLHNASPRDYTVAGAVSPSFLGFPVGSYASGFSTTAGLAGALPVGVWNLGLAGSLRVSGRFTPYQDAAGPITYKPGVEGRVRGGADGLIGASRLSFALTYSTFGDDEFGNGGARRGLYHPGPRWLAEAALIAPLGGSTLNLSVWNFRRLAGDTTGASARNRENLSSADLSIAIPLGTRLVVEPLVSGRHSAPQAGKATMLGLGGTVRLGIGERFSVAPTARYDWGWLEDSQGVRNDLRGGYASVFLRATF